tara:strand:- start:202 stop:597 length:396 start_codon:yes stop_codon:yes gene_type:complete
MNYSDILKKSNNNSVVYNSKSSKLLDNGYSIIRRNKDTNNIEIIYSRNYEDNKKLEFEKKNNILVNKMIANWNNFRNKELEYYGSRSIYYKYKETIENMVEEDNRFNKELYDLTNNNTLFDSDGNSDVDDF